MATAVLTGELRRLAGDVEEVSLAATSYRAALRELAAAYPGMDSELFDKYNVAIDGDLIHAPLLQTFGEDSELVFIPKIAAG